VTRRLLPGASARRPTDRDVRAFVVFAVGLLVLFGFFAGGAFVGRWSRLPEAPVAPQPDPAPAGSPSPADRTSSTYFLVEVLVTDDRAAAESLVGKLRRQYTSATVETDQTDQKYHVYVGPYDEAAATTVATELRGQGEGTVELKPYRR